MYRRKNPTSQCHSRPSEPIWICSDYVNNRLEVVFWHDDDSWCFYFNWMNPLVNKCYFTAMMARVYLICFVVMLSFWTVTVSLISICWLQIVLASLHLESWPKWKKGEISGSERWILTYWKRKRIQKKYIVKIDFSLHSNHTSSDLGYDINWLHIGKQCVKDNESVWRMHLSIKLLSLFSSSTGILCDR